MLSTHFIRRFLLFFSVFLGSIIHAQKVEDLIQVSVLSDLVKISPGGQGSILVKVELKPEWHVYWKTSGESGFPTTIEWEAVNGFQMGDLKFPTPLLYEFQEMVSYVHKDSFYLLCDFHMQPDFTSDEKFL